MLNNLAAILGVGGGGAANSYESIATVTVGAGGSSSVTFSSIPSTYKHLQVRYTVQSVSTGPLYMGMRFNNDSASNYAYHELYGDGGSVVAGAGANTSFAVGGDGFYSTPSFGAGIVDLLEYSNTNIYKTSRILSGQDTNGSGYIYFISNLWRSTSAINQIDLFMSSGNIAQYSSFALYGVK